MTEFQQTTIRSSFRKSHGSPGNNAHISLGTICFRQCMANRIWWISWGQGWRCSRWWQEFCRIGQSLSEIWGISLWSMDNSVPYWSVKSTFDVRGLLLYELDSFLFVFMDCCWDYASTVLQKLILEEELYDWVEVELFQQNNFQFWREIFNQFAHLVSWLHGLTRDMGQRHEEITMDVIEFGNVFECSDGFVLVMPMKNISNFRNVDGVECRLEFVWISDNKLR